MGNIEFKISDSEQEFLKKIGQTVRKYRKEIGLSQYDLADKARVADNIIGQIERAESNTSIVVLHRVCKALGIELAIEKKILKTKKNEPTN